MKKTVKFSFVILLPLYMMTACTHYEAVQPTASLHFTPYSTPTVAMTLTNTSTATLQPEIASDCKIGNENGNLYVLSDDVIFALGPDREELDRVLADNFPEWAAFEQTFSSGDTSVVQGTGTIVRRASFQEQFALNSAVTLVTLGTSLDWQIPADRDLYSKALVTGETLVGLWHEWNLNENNIQANYPHVSNASTYVLYIFFDQDVEKLELWCHTYRKLFMPRLPDHQ